MTHTPRHRLLVVAAAAALLAVGLGVAPAGADPLSDARRDRDQTQAAAVAAVQRYTDALAEQARQEAEIARLEAEIPVLKAKAAELRAQVRDRAVQLYQDGTSTPLQRMIEAENVVAAARALQLTSSAASHDRAAAVELKETATKLEAQEAELRTRKAVQDELVLRLVNERAMLDIALASAQAAVQTLEAIALSQQEFAPLGDAAAGQVATGASVCPIRGPVAFVNDWGAPRSGGRTHQGNDMFSPMGTPNVAVVDGYSEQNLDNLGGTGIMLHGKDGNVYYYAHLSAYEGPSRFVTAGEVIGYVGDTGNARGGATHTHFGIKPGGGAYVNPYPTIRVLCPQ
jgi:peptidoglycan LD-endopeptidase LytH